MSIRVTVWGEFRHEKKKPKLSPNYPKGMHKAIADLVHVAAMANDDDVEGFATAGAKGRDECAIVRVGQIARRVRRRGARSRHALVPREVPLAEVQRWHVPARAPNGGRTHNSLDCPPPGIVTTAPGGPPGRRFSSVNRLGRLGRGSSGSQPEFRPQGG